MKFPFVSRSISHSIAALTLCKDQIEHPKQFVSSHTHVLFNTSKTDIDECASDPCKNSGTCTDQANGYNCVCAEGFAGPQCATIGESYFRAQLVFISYRFFVH